MEPIDAYIDSIIGFYNSHSLTSLHESSLKPKLFIQNDLQVFSKLHHIIHVEFNVPSDYSTAVSAHNM